MHAPATTVFGFVRLLAGTAALQVVAQLLVFIAGIVVIRHLSLEQYAFYTLATAMLGVATTLSDCGMRNAVIAQGASLWQHPDRLGPVINAGLAIRRKVALVSALIVCPVLFALVTRQGGTSTHGLLLCGAVLPVFFAATSSPLLEVPLRLHQRLRQLQLLQAFAGVARVACVLLALIVWPVAWLVVLSGFLPQLLLNAKLRSGIARFANLRAPKDELAQSKISSQILRAMPDTIYYVLASQLTVILISIFGTTEDMAHVGALGRLALVVSFLLAMFQLVALPRYARIPQKEHDTILRTYLLLLGGIASAAGLAVACAGIAPEAVLYILGSQYSSLTSEVVLAVAAGGLAVVASAASSMSAVRGIVVSPWISIPPGIAVQLLLICLLPLDSVSSMFCLSLAMSGVQVVASVTNFLRSLHRAR